MNPTLHDLGDYYGGGGSGDLILVVIAWVVYFVIATKLAVFLRLSHENELRLWATFHLPPFVISCFISISNEAFGFFAFLGLFIFSLISFGIGRLMIDGSWKNGRRKGGYAHVDRNSPVGEKYVGGHKENKGQSQEAENVQIPGGNEPANSLEFVEEHEDDRGNGNKYVGEFKNGDRHGQGTYTWSTGEEYIGEWKYNKMHGQGTMIYADGSRYVGMWQADLEHGQGVKTFTSGRKYVGEWKDGNYHGQGTMIYANGDEYVGWWENGLQVQGTTTRPNGKQVYPPKR
jgi:hypothetical protein